MLDRWINRIYLIYWNIYVFDSLYKIWICIEMLNLVFCIFNYKLKMLIINNE